jgi:hypothetical protein
LKKKATEQRAVFKVDEVGFVEDWEDSGERKWWCHREKREGREGRQTLFRCICKNKIKHGESQSSENKKGTYY